MRRGEVVKGTKTALVTGASTGIGRQYAEQLAELGYNLIIVSRTEQTLQEVCLGLHSMCVGAESKYFNGHTNITDDTFLCFGVKGGRKAAEAFMKKLNITHQSLAVLVQ